MANGNCGTRHVALVLACLVAGAPTAAASESEIGPAAKPFVDWARPRAIALRALDAAGSAAMVDAQQTKRIEVAIGAARIVALGEPAHGAHEPLAFRNILFRHLVENLGFTAIALESGLSESQRMNDFVLGAAGDAAQIARNGFTWGFGDFAENVELIRWMRAYNADNANRRKIRIYGIDLSGGDGGGFPRARVSLDSALSYLDRVDPVAARHVRASINPWLDRFTDQLYRSVSPAEQQGMRSAIDGVDALFERARTAFVAASSATDYEWARRSVAVARELELAFRVWPAGDSQVGLPPELYKVAAIRDHAMAENVRWAFEREGSTGRVLLFAHNAHVMNASARGGIWDVYAQAPAAMGQHLRSIFGKELLIIGASSVQSAPGLPAMKPLVNGMDAALRAIGLPCFLLDLRTADRAARARAWLRQPRPLAANFVSELVLSPSDAFDAFVFFDHLTPARQE